MSLLVAWRPERRVERAARRLDSPSAQRRPQRLGRAIVVTAGLVSSLITVSAPSGQVLALEATVSGPAAALTTGLQPAQRLDPPAPTAPGLASDVQAVLDITNAERTARGVAPLQYHAQLTQAAHAHAADQYSRNCLTTLNHTGTDGSNPGTRIARTGLSVRTWGENIACNQRSAAQVMTAWMNSNGHRANILNGNFTHIGISVTLDSFGHPYWVQVFGTPR